MRILMCRPDYYAIEYEINPWMKKERGSDPKKALHQWEALHKTIRGCGAQIELVAPGRGLPDMTFAANAGLFYKGKVILANFKMIERKGEVAYFQSWFEKNGFHLVNKPGEDQNHYYFEGAGDALVANGKIFVGYGFRTEPEFFQTSDWIDPKHTILCELVNPYYYHIDTCFCPLNEKQAIWFPDAFSPKSQELMSRSIELIDVVEEEARRFACNSVVIHKQIIIPSGCPKLVEKLKNLGLTVHSCEVDEYIKAGGACKCLTMRLD